MSDLNSSWRSCGASHNDILAGLDAMCGAEGIEMDGAAMDDIPIRQDNGKHPMAAKDSLALRGQDRLSRSDDYGEDNCDKDPEHNDSFTNESEETAGVFVGNNKELERRRRRDRCRLASALWIAILLIVVLVAVLMVRLREKSPAYRSESDTQAAAEDQFNKDIGISQATSAPTLHPTPVPTPAPTTPSPSASPTTSAPTSSPSAPPTAILQTTLAYAIVAPLIEDPNTLTDPNSPQGLALQQIADEGLEDDFSIIQRFAMISSFFSMGGEAWEVSRGWNRFGDDECRWHGVSMCRYQKHELDHAASNLMLGDNGLTGSIPSELCLLDDLEGVNLERNQLTGPVPDCFTTLPKLNILNLHDNALTGTLDSLFHFDGVANPVYYSELRLHNNNFSGSIPESMAFLLSASVLTLHGNPELTGSLQAFCNRGMVEITADCDNVECDCCTCY